MDTFEKQSLLDTLRVQVGTGVIKNLHDTTRMFVDGRYPKIYKFDGTFDGRITIFEYGYVISKLLKIPTDSHGEVFVSEALRGDSVVGYVVEGLGGNGLGNGDGLVFLKED